MKSLIHKPLSLITKTRIRGLDAFRGERAPGERDTERKREAIGGGSKEGEKGRERKREGKKKGRIKERKEKGKENEEKKMCLLK